MNLYGELNVKIAIELHKSNFLIYIKEYLTFNAMYFRQIKSIKRLVFFLNNNLNCTNEVS